MDDELTIPDFLRRAPLTADEAMKLRRKQRRECRYGRPALSQADRKVNRDREGRPLPRNMDAASWALLAELEKTERVKQKAAKQERFRILAAERAERARIKREAKAATEA
jgi:hypothetical protein